MVENGCIFLKLIQLKQYRIRNKINIDDLYIQITPGDNPKQAEKDAIYNYVKKFADLPPLNGQYSSFEPEWSMFSEQLDSNGNSYSLGL